jgi:hypothetical protein
MCRAVVLNEWAYALGRIVQARNRDQHAGGEIKRDRRN